jgi:hypothetical protein
MTDTQATERDMLDLLMPIEAIAGNSPRRL